MLGKLASIVDIAALLHEEKVDFHLAIRDGVLTWGLD